MTLITRLMTNQRTLLLADGRITQSAFPLPIIKSDSEKKIINLNNGSIGLSGSAEFGDYIVGSPPEYKGKREFRVYEEIQTYLNENKINSLNRQTIENIGAILNAKINEFHNGKYFDSGPAPINLFITYFEKKLYNVKLTIRKSGNRYIMEMSNVEDDPIVDNFYFDINLPIEKDNFLVLLHETSKEIYGEDLSSKILNNMNEDEIKAFGLTLYEKFNGLTP